MQNSPIIAISLLLLFLALAGSFGAEVLTPLEANFMVQPEEELLEPFSLFRKGFRDSAPSENKVVFRLADRFVFLSIVDEETAEVLWIDTHASAPLQISLEKEGYKILAEMMKSLVAEARFAEEPHSDINLLGSDLTRAYVFVKNGLRWNGAHSLTPDRYEENSIVQHLIGLGQDLFHLRDWKLEDGEVNSVVEFQLKKLIQSAEDRSDGMGIELISLSLDGIEIRSTLIGALVVGFVIIGVVVSILGVIRMAKTKS